MSDLIHDELYETRNILLSEITSLSYPQFNSRINENTWSIAQVCHHLVLVEQATIYAIARGLKKDDDTQPERKNVHLLLNRTKKFKSPEIVEPSRDPFEVQTIVDLLNDSRNKLLAFLGTINDKSFLTEKSYKHPVLGELPLDQWIQQIYLHERRHIDQINEIKVRLDSKSD